MTQDTPLASLGKDTAIAMTLDVAALVVLTGLLRCNNHTHAAACYRAITLCACVGMHEFALQQVKAACVTCHQAADGGSQ